MEAPWNNVWRPIRDADVAARLEQELCRELVAGHLLHGVPVAAIARRSDCDDVLFLRDSSDRVALVHLTWKGDFERNLKWPQAVLYDCLDDWIERGMSEN